MRFFDLIPIVIIIALLIGSAQTQSVPVLSDTYITPSVEIQKNEVPVTIRFTGDVMLGRHVETLITRAGNNPNYVTERLELPSEVDYSVINFESAMTEPHRQTPSMTFQFATKASNLAALVPLGVTHASLANNHATDYGSVGYSLTKDSLREYGIQAFGHPTQVSEAASVSYLTHNNQRVALIGLHTLFREMSSAELGALMHQVALDSDIQIVYIHWGDEYILTANTSQQELARELVALGADLIIGHHPHVVQDIAIIDGVIVLYSLGNFIFDQYFSKDVMEGLIVDVSMTSTRLGVALHPITSSYSRSQPEVMTGSERTGFLTALADRSSPELAPMIQAGYIQAERLAIAP
jgi:poly-gamma-glutamate synthesis protein (capsule biosynthesis protein)